MNTRVQSARGWISMSRLNRIQKINLSKRKTWKVGGSIGGSQYCLLTMAFKCWWFILIFAIAFTYLKMKTFPKWEILNITTKFILSDRISSWQHFWWWKISDWWGPLGRKSGRTGISNPSLSRQSWGLPINQECEFNLLFFV